MRVDRVVDRYAVRRVLRDRGAGIGRVERRVVDARIDDVGVVRLDAQAVPRPRQEIEEALVRHFEALDRRALFVERRLQDHVLADTVVGDGFTDLAQLDVVVELLVEEVEGERAHRGEVVFHRHIELVGGDRLQAGIAARRRVGRDQVGILAVRILDAVGGRFTGRIPGRRADRDVGLQVAHVRTRHGARRGKAQLPLVGQVELQVEARQEVDVGLVRNDRRIGVVAEGDGRVQVGRAGGADETAGLLVRRSGA